MNQFRSTVCILILGGISFFANAVWAVAVLQLNCNITNNETQVYREVKISKGNDIEIDCQNFDNCKNSIYSMKIGYNGASADHEQVTVEITDAETNKVFLTEYTMLPISRGSKRASLNIGYGDVIKSMDEIPDMIENGRFLRISCDRMN